MGSIDLHQSAGLSLQPEAAQGIPQNLSTAIFTRPTHTQKIKKQSGYVRPLVGRVAVVNSY